MFVRVSRFCFFFVTVVCGLQVQHVMSYYDDIIYDDMRDEGWGRSTYFVWSVECEHSTNGQLLHMCKLQMLQSFPFFFFWWDVTTRSTTCTTTHPESWGVVHSPQIVNKTCILKYRYFEVICNFCNECGKPNILLIHIHIHISNHIISQLLRQYTTILV